MNQEKQVISFVKNNTIQLNELQRQFATIFNECGREINSENAQLALTGIIINMMLQSTNTPPQIQKNLLQAIKEKIK